MLQTKICPVKWEPLSLYSSEGIPQVGIIFSNGTLLTAMAVTLQHGNASTQQENIPKSLPNIFKPLRGRQLKSTCHISKGPQGREKCPIDV